MLFALPGVGNVGKAALEGLTQANECTELVRLPPYSCLATIWPCIDEDGLLTPPHLSLCAIESVNRRAHILTLTGTSQPLEPEHQGSMAHALTVMAL